MKIYKEAIVKTLAYSAVFKHPLTLDQIWRFLIWDNCKKLSFLKFSKDLDELVKKKKVFHIDSLYLLKNKRSWLVEYKRQKREGQRKLSIARKTAFLLSYIPTIEFIGLSGKLALSVAERREDIDLFIISKKNTLWISRILVLAFLSFVGIKRSPKTKDTKDRICANMFINSDMLRIPKSEQDLFCAHEVSQLVPLVSKNNTYDLFLKENAWVKEYLPNSIKITKVATEKESKIFGTYFFEQIAYKFQLWYMSKNRTTEVVKKNYVRFHPQDARTWVLPQYYKSIKIIK